MLASTGCPVPAFLSGYDIIEETMAGSFLWLGFESDLPLPLLRWSLRLEVDPLLVYDPRPWNRQRIFISILPTHSLIEASSSMATLNPSSCFFSSYSGGRGKVGVILFQYFWRLWMTKAGQWEQLWWILSLSVALSNSLVTMRQRLQRACTLPWLVIRIDPRNMYCLLLKAEMRKSRKSLTCGSELSNRSAVKHRKRIFSIWQWQILFHRLALMMPLRMLSTSPMLTPTTNSRSSSLVYFSSSRVHLSRLRISYRARVTLLTLSPLLKACEMDWGSPNRARIEGILSRMVATPCRSLSICEALGLILCLSSSVYMLIRYRMMRTLCSTALASSKEHLASVSLRWRSRRATAISGRLAQSRAWEKAKIVLFLSLLMFQDISLTISHTFSM